MKVVTDEIGHNRIGQPWRHRFSDERNLCGVSCYADFRHDVLLWANGRIVLTRKFDPATTDCGPLVAYCEGHMPAYAFADWLEEQVSDFPPEGLAILRERAEGE